MMTRNPDTCIDTRSSRTRTSILDIVQLQRHRERVWTMASKDSI